MATVWADKELNPLTVILREADEEECWAAGLTPPQALLSSMENSDDYQVVRVDGAVAAAWGYASCSLFSFRCKAWLLTTGVVEDHRVLFTRSSIRVMRFLFEKFEEVEVLVHLNHKAALRWLAWLGFKVEGRWGDFVTMVAKRSNFKWVFYPLLLPRQAASSVPAAPQQQG